MKLKKGYDPRTTKRARLLKACMEKKYSASMILELLDKVNEMPEEEREARAEELLKELDEADA